MSGKTKVGQHSIRVLVFLETIREEKFLRRLSFPIDKFQLTFRLTATRSRTYYVTVNDMCFAAGPLSHLPAGYVIRVLTHYAQLHLSPFPVLVTKIIILCR